MACSFPVKIFRRRGSRASSSSFRPKPGVARCHSWQGRAQKWRGSRLLQGFVFPLSPFIRWAEACLLASCRLRSRSGAKHMAGVLSYFCGGYVRLSCRVLFGAMKLCACRFQFRRRCKWSLVTLRRCAPAIPAYREHYPAPPRPIPPHRLRIDDRFNGHCFGLFIDVFDCKPGVKEEESLGATPHDFSVDGMLFYVDPHNEIALSPQCTAMTVRTGAAAGA